MVPLDREAYGRPWAQALHTLRLAEGDFRKVVSPHLPPDPLERWARLGSGRVEAKGLTPWEFAKGGLWWLEGAQEV